MMEYRKGPRFKPRVDTRQDEIGDPRKLAKFGST